MRTITITAHERPDYLRHTLDSLLAQPPELLRSYELLVGIDPLRSKSGSDAHTINPFIQAAISVFQSTSQMTVTTVRRDRPLGINWNNHDLIGRAFAIGSSYNLALEDDVELAPDALRLVEWHRQREDQSVLNLFNKSADGPEVALNVYAGYHFCPFAWACPSVVWHDLAANWMTDPRGWDWTVEIVMRRLGIPSLTPMVSRARHIGVVGTHFDAETHAAYFPPHLTFQQAPAVGEFKINDVVATQ